MVIGSHNAWSHLSTKKWWMNIINFIAKCQRVDIQTQYNKYDVRCFDVRIRFDSDRNPIVSHGIIEYNYSSQDFLKDLAWLNSKKDVIIRIMLDIRGIQYSIKSREYKNRQIVYQRYMFAMFYHQTLRAYFPNLRFINCKELPSGNKIIEDAEQIKEYGNYSSVSNKWYHKLSPLLHAKNNNKTTRAQYQDTDNLVLMDFVDI